MARNSVTVLNKSGDSGHLCLLPFLKGIAFSFSPLSMMLAVSLSHVAFIMMTRVLQHFDDKGMEHCDDKGHGAL